MALDLVIRGGSVIDGSGGPRFGADVGISQGRIACIGRVSERGIQEIDAQGQVVTPGFIDGHTHMDAQLNWNPLGECSCYHGVTSVVMGNCGFTLAPVRQGQEDLVMRNLERAEAIPASAMTAGIPWSWESFPEYLDYIDGLPKGINYSVYIGHSALRTWVMGERAFTDEATEDDLAKLRAEVDRALASGAIGFSTSLSAHHETSDDRPVASRQASWDEICHLVDAVSASGAGVFEFALPDDARSADPAVRRQFFAKLHDLATSSGVPVTHGVVPFLPEAVDAYDQLAWMDAASSTGGRAFAQTHSKGTSLIVSFETQLPYDALPVWCELRALPLQEQEHRLREPELRGRLVDIANSMASGTERGAGPRPPDYATMEVLDSALSSNRTVGELAAEAGADPVDIVIDLALKSDMHQLFSQPTLRQRREDLLEIMRHPRSVMTFSDSGAHVYQISDASIQTYLLAHWVRERQAFTLEEAIRMVTLVPALAWGLRDRGLIHVGMAADLNVFDPESVAPGVPYVVHDLPGGAKRLMQKSVGISATIVGGEVVLTDGAHTGALPGRLLRSGIGA